MGIIDLIELMMQSELSKDMPVLVSNDEEAIGLVGK